MYKLAFILVLMSGTIVHANTIKPQIVQVRKNSEEVVKIQVPGDIFQLSVKDERIKNIYKLRGNMSVTDNEKGKVYIKPLSDKVRIDLDVEGASSVEDVELKLEMNRDSKLDFDTLVVELIDDDYIQRFIARSLDNKAIEASHGLVLGFIPKLPLYLDVTSIKTYKAFGSNIYHFFVRNIDLDKVKVTAKDIDCKNPCKAIGVDKTVLLPGEETQIIIVR